MSINTLTISRVFPFSAEALFSKYSDPIALARWWGPAGNTNTFHSFEFTEGGKWVFTMHSLGQDYHNEWIFRKIEKNRILMDHTVAPFFSIEVLLEATSQHETKMTWIATFEDENFLKGARDFIIEKNNENFDRLAEELKHFPL